MQKKYEMCAIPNVVHTHSYININYEKDENQNQNQKQAAIETTFDNNT